MAARPPRRADGRAGVGGRDRAARSGRSLRAQLRRRRRRSSRRGRAPKRRRSCAWGAARALLLGIVGYAGADVRLLAPGGTVVTRGERGAVGAVARAGRSRVADGRRGGGGAGGLRRGARRIGARRASGRGAGRRAGGRRGAAPARRAFDRHRPARRRRRAPVGGGSGGLRRSARAAGRALGDDWHAGRGGEQPQGRWLGLGRPHRAPGRRPSGVVARRRSAGDRRRRGAARSASCTASCASTPSRCARRGSAASWDASPTSRRSSRSRSAAASPPRWGSSSSSPASASSRSAWRRSASWPSPRCWCAGSWRRARGRACSGRSGPGRPSGWRSPTISSSAWSGSGRWSRSSRASCGTATRTARSPSTPSRGRALDRAVAALTVVVPRGFLIGALAILAPRFGEAALRPGAFAASLGGVLFVASALRKLVAGLPRARRGGDRLAEHRRSAGPRRDRRAPGDRQPRRPPPRRRRPRARRASSRPVPSAFATPGAPSRFSTTARCEIRRGDRLLLEGPSGGGKSTLAALLCGPARADLRQPPARRRRTERARRRALAARVGAAPQFHENHVFSASLLFNLLLGRAWPPRREDVAEAEAICRELDLGPLLGAHAVRARAAGGRERLAAVARRARAALHCAFAFAAARCPHPRRELRRARSRDARARARLRAQPRGDFGRHRAPIVRHRARLR